MKNIAYVNGDFVPHDEAKVSIFDRGFLFSDGIYDISPILNGKFIDNDVHLNRLQSSAQKLELDLPISLAEIEKIQYELLEKNDVTEGRIYVQVTRGVAERDFEYPKNAKPSLVMFLQEKTIIDHPYAVNGINIITLPDIRWMRRDIKTTQLLAAAMAKEAAHSAGAKDAWFIEDGYITEGSSNNAYIVTEQGNIVTRQLGNEILPGITRSVVLEIAKRESIKIEERPFDLEEAYAAKEAFLTSASSFVWPVIKINDKPIGDGKVGSLTKKLRELYIEKALNQ